MADTDIDLTKKPEDQPLDANTAADAQMTTRNRKRAREAIDEMLADSGPASKKAKKGKSSTASDDKPMYSDSELKMIFRLFDRCGLFIIIVVFIAISGIIMGNWKWMRLLMSCGRWAKSRPPRESRRCWMDAIRTRTGPLN